MEERTDGSLNIWFFSHYFPPEGNAPASRVFETCKVWSRLGHRVTVVTCVPNVPNGVVYDGYSNRWTQEEVVDGIRVIRIWTYVAANKGTLKRTINYLSYPLSAVAHMVFRSAPDIILATSPQFFCGWAGVLMKWLKRRPFVLEIRDIWPESIVEVGAMKSSAIERALQVLELWMYRSASHVVTVGQGYRSRLLERDVPDEKMTVITNGFDRETFDVESTSFSGNSNVKFVCSYVGTIGMASGLQIVLRAAAKLKGAGRDDILFKLVGDGAEREELEAQAASEDLDNIEFTGRLSKSAIPDALQSSDACLVHLRKTPLFETVLPSKMLEAMAMKRPVILGVAGDAARVLNEAEAGICITPEDEDELLDAIERLRGDPQLGRQFGESGYSYVCEHHDRESLSLDYLALLKSVLSGDCRQE